MVKIDKDTKEHYCKSLQKWGEIISKKDEHFARAYGTIESAISKSCLLDRMLNCGENPSQTLCPVHEGRWSGCHWGWPGSVVVNTKGEERPGDVSEQCQEWYDAGCRCYQHGCGCTTGWQPDEHCGCKEK